MGTKKSADDEKQEPILISGEIARPFSAWTTVNIPAGTIVTPGSTIASSTFDSGLANALSHNIGDPLNILGSEDSNTTLIFKKKLTN